MRQWIFIAVFIFALMVFVCIGSPASQVLFWKLTGWAICVSFIGGVVALPCYCLHRLFSPLIRKKLSARQSFYFNSLGLALGVTMLVLVLGAFAHP